MSNDTAVGGQQASGGGQTRVIRPRLTFYHANSKGTGSAVQFEMSPGNARREGAVYMTMANQKSIAAVVDGQKQYATFDWAGSMLIKLNFNDISQILMVLKGLNDTMGGGKGLYHQSRLYQTIINCTRHNEPPLVGVALDASRKSKSDAQSGTRSRIFLNEVEVFGLSLAFEQIMGQLAFGVGPATYGTAVEVVGAPDDEELPF